MNLVVSFVNGREKYFKVDDYSVDEDMGYLKIYQNDVAIGMISLNQVVYWYAEA